METLFTISRIMFSFSRIVHPRPANTVQKFCRFEFDGSSLGCAEHVSLIHGEPSVEIFERLRFRKQGSCYIRNSSLPLFCPDVSSADLPVNPEEKMNNSKLL